MAKDLPYFKFFCSEWNDGDIALEDLMVQGLFINLCSYYWSNECNVTLTKCKKKFKTASDADFKCLLDSNIIKVDLEDNLLINFLIEQFYSNEETVKLRSKAGKASAESRKAKALSLFNKDSTHVEQMINLCSTETQLLREEKIREEKIREEQENTIEFPFKEIEFKVLWYEWKMFRVEKQNPLTPSSEKKALKVLFEESGGNVDLAIKAINKAIASGHLSLNPKPEPTYKQKETEQQQINGFRRARKEYKAE